MKFDVRRFRNTYWHTIIQQCIDQVATADIPHIKEIPKKKIELIGNQVNEELLGQEPWNV